MNICFAGPTVDTGRSGFSLVEVVLALGIVVFAVLGLLGLASTVIDQNAAVKRDLVISSIFQQLTRQIQQKEIAEDKTLYFSVEGNLSVLADAAYHCKITFSDITPPAWPDKAAPLKMANIALMWPAGAASPSTQTSPVLMLP